jgi:transcriptional regulator with XRE-family HTH domain
MAARRFDPKRLERSVAARVGELRRQRGLTQADLASRLRCTPRYVAQIEAGRNVTLHTLAKLAHILDVEPAALLEAPGSLSAPSPCAATEAQGGRLRRDRGAFWRQVTARPRSPRPAHLRRDGTTSTSGPCWLEFPSARETYTRTCARPAASRPWSPRRSLPITHSPPDVERHASAAAHRRRSEGRWPRPMGVVGGRFVVTIAAASRPAWRSVTFRVQPQSRSSGDIAPAFAPSGDTVRSLPSLGPGLRCGNEMTLHLF